MARKGNKRLAELTVRLVELGSKTLIEQFGVPEQQAREAMREIAHNLSRHYGGTTMYVPQDAEFVMTKRDLLIYEKLGSGNANEVAREFELSVQQVYAIAKSVREQLVKKRQGKLPGFEDPTEDATA